MKRFLRLSSCLVATISLGTALAQTSTNETDQTPAAAGSAVAYVYVSRPTHVDGFAASSNGKLVPVPGSPFSNIALSHMSVNKKFLFGASDDGKDIITYSIASNGALKKVAEIDALQYVDGTDCGPVGPTQIDHTGVTLYNYQEECDDTAWTQSFKIDENGELEFLNRVPATDDLSLSPFVLLGNNNYGYITGSSFELPGAQNFIYKRDSNGMLEQVYPRTVTYPKPGTPGDVWDPEPVSAADPTDHLALLLYEVNPNTSDSNYPVILLSFTADADGNFKTTNTYEDAPTPELAYVGTISISPSGKLLALGGAQTGAKGLQIFHFDGSSPITKFTGVLHSSETFLQFAWDKNNHLYALSTTNLHVYEATSTEIKEVSGSPYSIPEASSVIVLSRE